MPRPGPRTTYRYSDQFKATTVRLSELPGVSVGDVAHSLYIHLFMLSRWRKLAREGSIVTKGIELDPAISAELKELREVKRRYWPPSAATWIFTITSAYTRHWIIKHPWNSRAPAIDQQVSFFQRKRPPQKRRSCSAAELKR